MMHITLEATRLSRSTKRMIQVSFRSTAAPKIAKSTTKTVSGCLVTRIKRILSLSCQTHLQSIQPTGQRRALHDGSTQEQRKGQPSPWPTRPIYLPNNLAWFQLRRRTQPFTRESTNCSFSRSMECLNMSAIPSSGMRRQAIRNTYMSAAQRVFGC